MIDIFGIIDKLLDNRKIVFFDIGGAGGSHPRWELLSNHIEIFYSEPNSDSYEKLQTLNSKKFNYAIGDKKGKNLLFITSKDECSSILRPNFTFLNNFPNPDRFNIVSEQSIEVTTIDDFSKIIDKKIHALKIDVQGAAYQVLNSGRQVISNDSLCVEVETEFCEVYAGQQLFPEIFNYLIEFGYKLVDINPIRWKRNSTTNIGSEIVFCDALFVKDPELISNDREKLSNLCVLLMAYGNFNYAFSIIEKYCLIESFEEISKNINDMESIIEQYNLNFQMD
uniref:Methyltransferase n=1 Tax=Methylophaga nitratireducenticrescens TaxID=754476 RepID=I1XHS6_METNJ